MLLHIRVISLKWLNWLEAAGATARQSRGKKRLDQTVDFSSLDFLQSNFHKLIFVSQTLTIRKIFVYQFFCHSFILLFNFLPVNLLSVDFL